MIKPASYELHSHQFSKPILVKLNEEDQFVRMEGALFALLVVEESILHPHHFTASNIYGVPEFHFRYQRKHPEIFYFKKDSIRIKVEISIRKTFLMFVIHSTGTTQPIEFWLENPASSLSSNEIGYVASAAVYATMCLGVENQHDSLPSYKLPFEVSRSGVLN